MSGSARKPLAEMETLALTLVRDLAPTCTRIEVAGSIRRRTTTVGDIEIVAISAGGQLERLLDTWLVGGVVSKRTNKRGHAVAWGAKFRALTWRGISVDVFLTTPDQWGLVLLLRTGPGTPELGWERWTGGANQVLVTPRSKGGLLPDDLRVADGWLWRGDRRLTTTRESDVFRALGLPYIEPSQRSITRYRQALVQPAPATPHPDTGARYAGRFWFGGTRDQAHRLAAGFAKKQGIALRYGDFRIDKATTGTSWWGMAAVPVSAATVLGVITHAGGLVAYARVEPVRGIARDYVFSAGSEQAARDLAFRMGRELNTAQVLTGFLLYRGGSGQWVCVLTITAADHDGVRAIHWRLQGGQSGHRGHFGAGARIEQVSYTQVIDEGRQDDPSSRPASAV